MRYPSLRLIRRPRQRRYSGRATTLGACQTGARRQRPPPGCSGDTDRGPQIPEPSRRRRRRFTGVRTATSTAGLRWRSRTPLRCSGARIASYPRCSGAQAQAAVPRCSGAHIATRGPRRRRRRLRTRFNGAHKVTHLSPMCRGADQATPGRERHILPACPPRHRLLDTLFEPSFLQERHRPVSWPETCTRPIARHVIDRSTRTSIPRFVSQMTSNQLSSNIYQTHCPATSLTRILNPR